MQQSIQEQAAAVKQELSELRHALAVRELEAADMCARKKRGHAVHLEDLVRPLRDRVMVLEQKLARLLR